MVHIGNDWDDIIGPEFEKTYYKNLRAVLKNEYKNSTVYPDMYNIFNALKYTSFSDVKAVIIGQDPYHSAGQAHGLCFSVKKGIIQPPSLVNIFKELNRDLGLETPPKNFGELTSWAKNGVLLLNNVLTVREAQPNSHKNIGWETFTDAVISALNKKTEPIVFILWGANARNKANLITNPIHLKLTAAHPSPLSAYNGFFGCKHFSKTNQFLISNGISPIDWTVSDLN